MASAIENGLIKLVAERSGLGTRTVFQYRSDTAVNAGGSPDGVLANLTADKQLFIGQQMPILSAGDILHLMFKPDAADGYDASDCVINVPYWEDGTNRPLNAASFGFTTDLPAATVAAQWVEFGSGYTVPANVKSAYVGNGQLVLSVQDDTA
jgi:hypothetical protein